MKRALLAWELGEGLGHLPALKAIALRLKLMGLHTVFALREVEAARGLLGGAADEIVQAPFWLEPKVPKQWSGSYADILAGNGYGSVAELTGLLSHWSGLIDRHKPDFLVCEHAPTAALAGYGRLPVAFVGNGFVVPPADEDWFAPYVSSQGELSHQAPVFRVVKDACAQLGLTRPEVLTAAFRGQVRGVFSFPELDPYQHCRREAVLGPAEALPQLLPPAAERKLFAYGAVDAAMIDEIVQGLMTVGPEAHVFFRGKLGARAHVLRSRGILVSDQAPDLTEALGAASVVFSHGGSGLTNAAYAAGRPQIIYPRHFEARATAQALVKLGCAVIVDPFEAKVFVAEYKRLDSDKRFSEAARSCAQRAQDFVRTAQSVERVCEAIANVM